MPVRFTGRILALCAVSALALVAFHATSAAAANLTVVYQAGPPSVDPHYSPQPSAKALRAAVFDALIESGNDGKPVPRIAESYRLIDDVTWEFKIRKDVVFSDGTPLTAEDVVFTYNRVPLLKDTPSPLTMYVRNIKSMKIIDPYTLQITNAVAAPMFPLDLSQIGIVSKKHGEGGTTADYNSGKIAIGAGQYKLVSFKMNDDIVLERNERYWGDKPVWEKILMKINSNDASRLASLLAGDADVVELVPYADVDRLRKDPKLSVWTAASGRVAYMTMPPTDIMAKSGAMLDPSDQPVKENPLANPKVREAMKTAINLEAFAQRIYYGEVTPSGQYVPQGISTTLPGIGPWVADEEKAKRLLEESGWANKFKLTLIGSATAVPEAQKVFESLAQTWTKVGIKTDVKLFPTPVYLQKRNSNEIAVGVALYVNSGIPAEGVATTLLHSFEGPNGFGQFNFGRYQNPELDLVIQKGMATHDDEGRRVLLMKAMDMALKDNVILPLWYYKISHASRKGIEILPRLGSDLRVQNIRLQ